MNLRHSLVTRLLVTSLLIAVASVVTTAWLAARTATRAITQEQGRSLAEDKAVYDLLLGYAATHSDWTGVQPLIAGRAAQLGRRITLLTRDRVPIADSTTGGPSLRTARPSATVDPLDVDLSLTGGTDRIDARAAGPFRVPAAEQAPLRLLAESEYACLRKLGYSATIEQLPSGRPAVISQTAGADTAACTSRLADTAASSEKKSLRTLGELTEACARPPGMTVVVRPDFTAFLVSKRQDDLRIAPLIAASPKVLDCVDKKRRSMLQPYVAPAALLFVTDPNTGAAQPQFTLSATNTVRIAAATGAVLLATIMVTVLVGRRLVRPLRALTANPHAPVVVRRRDEIGVLARALADAAERRDRAEALRRNMVGDVAHELRTPLTNIRSWLEAAQDGLAPTDPALLTLLHEEAVLLQHVIDDLSDLAAADSGTLGIHPEPTDIREALTHVVDAQRSAAAAAQVQLVVVVEGGPVLTVDPVRLRQIVGNLVSNAIRHTPPGGMVTLAAADGTITVRDTGTGIALADLSKVFDRFWRADESRSRSTGGSGLGLAIARQLTTLHGGTLEAASEPGRGATFTITFESPSRP